MTEADLPKKNDLQADRNNQELKVIKKEDEETKEIDFLSHNNTQITHQNYNEDASQEILKLALKDLQGKRKSLEEEIETLEKRKNSLEKEVSKTFSGQSDSIARRVKGFQEYLTGALQDLSNSVEQLDLIAQPVVVTPSPLDKTKAKDPQEEAEGVSAEAAIADTFKPDKELILQLLNQYLEGPDYYADPWKFRRSLESQDVEILEDWFFNMGGRGAQPSRGNRPRNVLVSAALIAILGELYGDRFQALVLASQPERLGEWRRGLQDALGLNREDFGPNSGVVLFERPGPLIERADRLEEENEVPLILIDAAEESIAIPILQFPIWLTFAATPNELYIEEELI